MVGSAISALMPQSTLVCPHRTSAEPAAVATEPTTTVVLRIRVSPRPSGRTPCCTNLRRYSRGCTCLNASGLNAGVAAAAAAAADDDDDEEDIQERQGHALSSTWSLLKIIMAVAVSAAKLEVVISPPFLWRPWLTPHHHHPTGKTAQDKRGQHGHDVLPQRGGPHAGERASARGHPQVRLAWRLSSN